MQITKTVYYWYDIVYVNVDFYKLNNTENANTVIPVLQRLTIWIYKMKSCQ